MKNNRGITLIALIITIIIMLILVSVSIRAAINGGLFQKAGQAVKDYGNKQNKEEALGNGNTVINGTEGSISDYVESFVNGTTYMPTIEAGTRANTNSRYQTATIPAGFTVSGIESEQSTENGLVIYLIPNSVTDAQITEASFWSADSNSNGCTDVKEYYDQFVWIPVANPNEMYGTDVSGNKLGKLYFYAGTEYKALNWEETTGGVMSWKDTKGRREPDIVTSYDNNAIYLGQMNSILSILGTNYASRL